MYLSSSKIALLVFIGGVNANSLLFHPQWAEFKYYSLGFSAVLSPTTYTKTHICMHTHTHTRTYRLSGEAEGMENTLGMEAGVFLAV